MNTRNSREKRKLANDEIEETTPTNPRQSSSTSSSSSSSSSSSLSSSNRKGWLKLDSLPGKFFKTEAEDLPAPSIAIGPPGPPPDNETEMDKLIEMQRFGNTKEWLKWSRLQLDARILCIKAVARLFIFHAGSKQHVTRDAIAKCLEELNPDFRSHVSAVLDNVNETLQKLFDYRIVPWVSGIGSKLPEFSGPTKGPTGSAQSSSSATPSYYVVNCAKSAELLCILADSASSAIGKPASQDVGTVSTVPDSLSAYLGFCYVVITAIFISPGRRLKAADLLALIRKIDPRFPETEVTAPKAGAKHLAVAVAELQLSFPGLLKKMKEDGYLTIARDSEAGKEDGLASVEMCMLGPRAYLEIGKTRLVKSYFAACGVPVNSTILHEIQQEDIRPAAAEEE